MQLERCGAACFAGLTVWVLGALGLPGQVPVGAEPTEVAFRNVAGRLYVRADLSAKGRSMPAHLLLELGLDVAFRLHGRTAGLLGLEAGDAVAIKIQDLNLKPQVPEVSRLRTLEYLTMEYAKDLEEIPVVGVLGFSAFAEARFELDYRAGRLRFLERKIQEGSPAPPVEETAPVSAVVDGVLPPQATDTSPLTISQGMARATVRALETKLLSAAVATGEADTWIESTLASSLGHPGGDLASALLGNIELTKYVALRPRYDEHVIGDQPPILLGNGFLSHFRVILDPYQKTLELLAIRKPVFPQEDQDAFKVIAGGDPDAIAAFFEKHKNHRAGSEGANVVLRQCLAEEPPNPEKLLKATRLLADTTPLKRRARTLLDLVEVARGRFPAAYSILRKPALELALEHAGEDDDAEAVFKTRSEIGGFLLEEEGEEALGEAYQHLLAAAFGMPRDGQVNVRLGRLYEKKKKFERAWSRYLQASITAEAGPEGLLGLKRLREQQKMTTPFDVDEMEKALEGRAPGFEPASIYKPKDEKAPTRRVLVEVFVGAHAEACGASELAASGLAAHFAGAEAIVLVHHLHAGGANALATPISVERAQLLQVDKAPSAYIDRQDPLTVGGKIEKASNVFRAYRDAAEARLLTPTPFELGLRGALTEQGTLEMAVDVRGPTDKSITLHAFVAERSLLYPGGNKVVFHRYTSRYDATDGGVLFPAELSERKWSGKVSLKAIGAELEDYLDQIEDEAKAPFPLRPTTVDARQVAVIAWIEANGEVLQAARYETHPKEDR